MLTILFGGALGAAIARKLRPQDGALQASFTVTGLFLGYFLACSLTTLVPVSTKTEEQQLTPYKRAGSPSVLVRQDGDGQMVYRVCLRSSPKADAGSCHQATFVAGREAIYEQDNSPGDGVLITTKVQRDTNSPLARWWAIPRQEKPVVTHTILAPLESLSFGRND